MEDSIDKALQALKTAHATGGPPPLLIERTIAAVEQAARTPVSATAPQRGAGSRVFSQRWRLPIAAAVVIVVFGASVVLFEGESPFERLAFADVANRALDTEAVSFVARERWGTARVLISQEFGTRLERDNGDLMIWNRDQMRTLMVDATAKQATLVQGPEEPDFDLYGWLRSLLSGSVESLGAREVGGRRQTGFRVIADWPALRGTTRAEFEVWADVETGLPVQLIGGRDGRVKDIVCDEICFDVLARAAQFELTPPPGYSVRERYGTLPGEEEPGIPGEYADVEVDAQRISVYGVNARVNAFTDEDDFSTPEAAYANIVRALVGGTGNAWRRVSVARLQEQFHADDSPLYEISTDEATSFLRALIIEVHVLDGTYAGVIARHEKPSGSVVFDKRSLELEDGRWLNCGHGRFRTLEQARADFLDLCRRRSP